MKKLYIIQKYVWAHSPVEAIMKDKETQVEEVYLNNNWMARPGTEERPGFLDEPVEKENGKEKTD